METRSLFEPGAAALPDVLRRQSRIRVLNGRRRSLESDRDRHRRRVNARRRSLARLEEMDDESRADWFERRRRLHVLG